jgi:sec-independent protein translocase protein TatA
MNSLETYAIPVWGFLNNPTALIAVVLILLLLFGGKNIPERMKGMGQGMREFKKGMESDDDLRHPDREAEEARLRAEIEEEVRRRIEAERQQMSTAQEDNKTGQRLHQ